MRSYDKELLKDLRTLGDTDEIKIGGKGRLPKRHGYDQASLLIN